MMNTRPVFKAQFSRGFVAVGPCKRCGKPVGSHGQHQFFIGLRFCIRKYIADRRAA
jgi:hypothetical protein